MKKKIGRSFLFISLAVFLAGAFTCAKNPSLVKWHPVEVPKVPLCSECHTDENAALNHSAGFNVRHKYYAAQRVQVCNVCHQSSFCADCHANRELLKPSDKFKDSPERFLPHRADYINQHRIDGKINPALCFKCHGRGNNQRCKGCHR